MTEPDTSQFHTAHRSSEGPGNQPGGIARTGSTEESSEGPGVKSGGIARSVAGKGIKRKLDAKSYDKKYEAVIAVEKGVKTKKQIAADFGIPSSTLSTWIKNSAEIKKKFLSGEVGPQRKKNRTAKFPEVEQALLAWFTNARSQNVSISGEILKEKARFFADNLGVSDSEFDCSAGWLERFKSRHSITFKRVCGESNAVQSNSKGMDEWKDKLSSILKDHDPNDIYNADETGIFYRLLPDKTLEFKSVSCHGGKQSKERLTAMVCANMTGTDKLPLLVIGKSVNPRCFKNVKTLPTLYKANKKAWMTSEFFTEWLRKIDDKMSKKKKSIVMIIDNCPAHPSVKKLKSVKLVFLPPNTTSVTQPMDQGIINNLKIHYRKLVIQRKIRAIDNKAGEVAITVLDAIRMLHQAWGSVTPKTIANCFHHDGFVTAENPDINTDIDSDDDPEDDIPLKALFGLDDYVAVDKDVPTCAEATDEDIIHQIVNKRDSDDDDDDDPQDTTQAPPTPKPSIESALSACDVLRNFLECTETSAPVLPSLATLNNFIVNLHLTRLQNRQTSITNFFQKSDRQNSDRD